MTPYIKNPEFYAVEGIKEAYNYKFSINIYKNGLKLVIISKF